ncbi:hypothetical protein OAS86_05870 [Gammaproteobacteria bacterium]|nr:hypothetical protein [Gammaproteobacteria bacterium]
MMNGGETESMKRISSSIHLEQCGWRGLISLALAAFILNQLLDFILLLSLDKNYSQLCRWDCGWYLNLLRDGYDQEPSAFGHDKGDAANWAFFPANSILTKAVHQLGVSQMVAVLLTSRILYLASIIGLLYFVSTYRPDISLLIPALIVTVSPYSIYANVGYTEPFFLLMSSIFFVVLKRGAYVRSGMAGLILSSTRFVGISAAVAYVVDAAPRVKAMSSEQRTAAIFGAFLIPLGLALYMVFLYRLTGDALAFSHIQIAWGRVPENPLSVLASGFSSGLVNLFWMLVSIFALSCVIYFLCVKRFELAVFSAICTLLPLSTGLWGMPRYVFWQAPILLAVSILGAWLPRAVFAVGLFFSVLGLGAMYYLWFAGTHIVV